MRIGELAGPRPEVLRPVQQGSLGQALEGRPELELTGLALEFDRQGFVRRCCQWEQARAWGQEVPPIRAIWESQASGLLAWAVEQELKDQVPGSVHREFGKRHCQWAWEMLQFQATWGSRPLVEEERGESRRQEEEERGESRRQGGRRSMRQWAVRRVKSRPWCERPYFRPGSW